MNKMHVALIGAAMGAGAMYLSDPRARRHRRAHLHEVAAHTSHTVKAVSGLQGPGPRKVPHAPATWLRWTPTTRLIAGVAGLVLVALSSSNRPVRGAAATGIAGMELIERALLGGRT